MPINPTLSAMVKADHLLDDPWEAYSWYTQSVLKIRGTNRQFLAILPSWRFLRETTQEVELSLYSIPISPASSCMVKDDHPIDASWEALPSWKKPTPTPNRIVIKWPEKCMQLFKVLVSLFDIFKEQLMSFFAQIGCSTLMVSAQSPSKCCETLFVRYF